MLTFEDLFESGNIQNLQDLFAKATGVAQKLDAIGQLAGRVAHDFNNLLMGIMGYTDLCLENIEEEYPIREWLDEIMQEAKRSADIVRQLLAFSRKQTGCETLLVVEDQHAVCKIIRKYLEPLGYTVYTAKSPARALEIMDESGGDIELLITDVVMPGMNGRELAEGVNFISKPITCVQLAEKLRDILGKSASTVYGGHAPFVITVSPDAIC